MVQSYHAVEEKFVIHRSNNPNLNKKKSTIKNN